MIKARIKTLNLKTIKIYPYLKVLFELVDLVVIIKTLQLTVYGRNGKKVSVLANVAALANFHNWLVPVQTLELKRS